MSVSLNERTLELLSKRSESLKSISKKTSLSEAWLDAYAYNRTKNPSVKKVQELYEYLTGGTLLDE